MTFQDFLDNSNITAIDFDGGFVSFGGVDDDYPTPTNPTQAQAQEAEFFAFRAEVSNIEILALEGVLREMNRSAKSDNEFYQECQTLNRMLARLAGTAKILAPKRGSYDV